MKLQQYNCKLLLYITVTDNTLNDVFCLTYVYYLHMYKE